MKMYQALFGADDGHPFGEHADEIREVYSPDDMDEPGFLVLWGGEDISPGIYGQKPNKYVHAPSGPSRRDQSEIDLYRSAQEKGMLIVAICRGAQLACALSGGTLIQHVDNHGRGHLIETDHGRHLPTTSLHHQMMYPFDIKHDLIAWSFENRSPKHVGEDNEPIDMEDLPEPEVVFFPESRCLAIQGHPEFLQLNSEFTKYCNELVREYLA